MIRALEVFKARHEFAFDIFYSELLNDWTEEQLRTIPHESMNSLLWVIWHVARVEDVGVTRFVMQEEQVLKSGNWNDKLGVTDIHFGFGSGHDVMVAMNQKFDVNGVWDYFKAVREYTYDAITRVTPEQLDEVLSRDEVNKVMRIEGVGLPIVLDEVENIYSGWTRLEALNHFSMTHYYWHGGEVRTIEGMLRHQ